MLLSTLGSVLTLVSAINAGLVVERDVHCAVPGWPSESNNFKRPGTKRSLVEQDALVSLNSTRTLWVDDEVCDQPNQIRRDDAGAPMNLVLRTVSEELDQTGRFD